jgi:hypothetical protein
MMIVKILKPNSMTKHKKIILNKIQIDEEISKLIQLLWNNGIKTIQCCKGGDIAKEKSRFTHMEGKNIVENAHIIFYKKDLEKIKSFLPKDTDYIIGDKSKTGYLSEWLGFFEGAWANFNLNKLK